MRAKSSQTLASAHALDGYQTWFNSQQHVNFVGTDNHVHEMYFDQQWIHTDLTRVAGAPAAAPGTALDGYQTTFNKQQHVNFIGADNHVHELYFDSQWHHNDLTVLAGAPAAAAGSALDGYQTSFNNQQHVNFIGADNHVHELYFDNRWHHNDLTVLAGASAAAAGSAVDGYETSFNNQQHVNFVGADNHVHELYFDNRWHHNDLTVLAGAPAAAAGSALDGYQTSFNNQQHVNFIGADNHVHELYFDNRWHHNDLTVLAGAPAAAVGSALDGYQTSFNNQQHVNFIDADNHVHELYFDNRWHHNDLTVLAGAPAAAAGSALDGYETSFNNQQHVNFVGADNHVHELYFDSRWHHNDLTANLPPVPAIPWVSAVGTWQIPTVAKPDLPPGDDGGWDSSSWVGIDGSGTDDVLQAGVQQYVGGNGVPSYTAWFEWFAPKQDGSPDYVDQVNIPNFPVAPGQTVFCSVRYVNNQTAGQIFFANQTTGQNFSITLAPPPGADFTGLTIEWIMESPEINDQPTSLPSFMPVVFNPASGVDLNGNTGNPLNGFASDIQVSPTSPVLTSVTLGTIEVTIDYLVWHANDLTQYTKAQSPAPGSALDGYQTTFNNQQHVNFIGADNHVHELYFDSQWHHNDLTALAGAPPAAAGSALDGYQTSFNNQQHVNFVGTDNHVHELYFDNRWHHNDLTVLAGAPPAAAGSALDGYQTSFNNQQHVNFVGTDNHVHELYFDNRWHHNDLTVLAGASAAAAGSAVDGYETSFNNQQHVNFVGADNHVHELYFDNRWHHNDLTVLAGAPAAAAGSALDGYQTSFNNQQHVNFIGADNHVHELYFDNRWHHNDLTVLAGAPAAAVGSALDGYQTSFNNQQHVNFIGADNHVHELYFDNRWHHNDLTVLAGAPAAATGSAVDGYETSFNNQQHVNFIGADNHVHELYY